MLVTLGVLATVSVLVTGGESGLVALGGQSANRLAGYGVRVSDGLAG